MCNKPINKLSVDILFSINNIPSDNNTNSTQFPSYLIPLLQGR